MVAKSDQHILQHYAGEERAFAEKMLDICSQVEQTYSMRTASFLNPRQEEIATAIGHHYGLQVFSSRSILPSEFVQLILAPDYYELDVTDFELTVLEIQYARKYNYLTHAQILGTLLNQLGIRREYLGDILVTDEQTVVIVHEKFVSLIETSITKIARVPVKWKSISLTDVDLPEVSDAKTKFALLSSMRLDKVVSAIFGVSRSVALKLIQAKQVKLDYAVVETTSKAVEIGQLLSVRGYGRGRIVGMQGYSKQGKMKVAIEVIKK